MEEPAIRFSTKRKCSAWLTSIEKSNIRKRNLKKKDREIRESIGFQEAAQVQQQLPISGSEKIRNG